MDLEPTDGAALEGTEHGMVEDSSPYIPGTPDIPYEFNLICKTFEVEFDNELLKDEITYTVDYHDDRISIVPRSEYFNRSKEDEYISFIASIVCAFFMFCKADDALDDDKMIRLFAQTFHQIVSTSVYDEKPEKPMVGIPSSFQLFGKTINIRPDFSMYKANGAMGLAKPHECEILLLPDNDLIPRSSADLFGTYLHEVVHLVFHAIGEDGLSANETTVNLLGTCLAQVFMSAEYYDPEIDGEEETE